MAGNTVSIERGWTSVDASIAGVALRFVNTHLETQAFSPLQVAQAQELTAILESEERPVILVGDFNSAANLAQTPTYEMLLDNDFVDTWTASRNRGPGLTCCQDDDLRNAASNLSQRIDFVFARGLGVAAASVVGGVNAEVVGEEQDDRSDSGLWPSDHAGVVTTLRLPPTP